ncbi:MAG: hypothetical protein ACH346_05230, partial [Chthoniobacterales bacterium]
MLSRLFFLCLLASLALNNLSAEEPFVKEQVTAANYCNFLNHRATASDPDHLYSEAMGHDPLAACIARSGAPGRWHYEVVAGRESYPIYYVSKLAQASYADRLQLSSSSPSSTSTFNFNSHIEDVSRLKEEASETGKLERINGGISSSATSTSTSNFNSHIEDVSSNNDSFQVEAASTMLTLASSSPTSTSNFNSCIEDASLIALAVFTGIGLTEEFGLEPRREATAPPASPAAAEMRALETACSLAKQNILQETQHDFQEELYQAQDKLQLLLDIRPGEENSGTIDENNQKICRQIAEIKTQINLLREKIAKEEELKELESVSPAVPSPGNDREMSSAEKEAKIYLRVAEKAKEEAIAATNTAQTAQAQADENKFNNELTAYAAARKTWLNVVHAYQAALTKAKAADPNNLVLGAALNKIISEAEVNTAVWPVYLTAIEPRKIEHFLDNAKGTLSRDNAEKAKSAWAHAVDAYKKIATRSAAHHDNLLLREILQQHLDYAQAREEFWNKAIHELQKNQDEQPIDETTHLKTLEKEKQIHHKSVRKYVWLKHANRSFEHWELPGELPNVASTVDINSIARPELLDEDLEKLGRKLLKPIISNGTFPAAKKITATASLSESGDSLNDASLHLAENETPTLTTPPLITIEKDFEAEIMDESLKPTEENRIRLEARKKANELTAKASTIAKAIKRARAVRAAENE